MGGAPCKVIIDGDNAGGMMAQFQSTIAGVNAIINDLDEYITDDERAAAIALSYELCDFADKIIRPMNDKYFTFFKALAEKYAGPYRK